MMSLVLVPGNLARSSASPPPNLIVQMGRLISPGRGRRMDRLARLDAAHDRLGPVDDRGRLDDVALHPELLRLETEREAEELRQVQDRHVELAADGALGERLLQVEVEVAQRARRHEAVGV